MTIVPQQQTSYPLLPILNRKVHQLPQLFCIYRSIQDSGAIAFIAHGWSSDEALHSSSCTVAAKYANDMTQDGQSTGSKPISQDASVPGDGSCRNSAL